MWEKVNKIFGNENAKTLKGYRKVVEKINALEPEMQAIEDKDFSKKTAEFQTRLEDGESLDDLIPEVFALVREDVLREDWLPNGDWAFTVEIPAGMKNDYIAKVGKRASDVVVKEMK